MVVEQILWIIGASIFLLLGSLHLFYTFFTNKFSSRNEMVIKEMKESFPILTKETTIWSAWIGFNASHSAGAIFIGLVNLILSIQYFELLRNSLTLLILSSITSLFYLFLAKRYWFRIPFAGILISSVCFVLTVIIILTK